MHALQFGPDGTPELFGIKLIGVNLENAKKLLFSVVFLMLMLLINRGISKFLLWLAPADRGKRGRVTFWVRQTVHVLFAVVLILGIVSIWFSDPTRLATAAGLVMAGIAFAMQRVITALAGYFVILRGNTFNIGDRITMGGVRGDVVALGFIQTTIMEMGQPPGEQGDDPSMWVRSRQYTGRIVTVTNDKIFDTPVYNYTREFPYIWEEMHLPIRYNADRPAAERILLDAANRHAVAQEKLAEDDLKEIERRFNIERADFKPRVYWRMTDNWLELTVRFITSARGVRERKDAMSRQIVAAMEQAKLEVASGTYEIVGLPEIRVRIEDRFNNGQTRTTNEFPMTK